MTEAAAVARAFDLVVVVASAGGPAALRIVLGGLPADFPAPVLVVQHRIPEHRDGLADILDRSCGLPVRNALAGHRLPDRGVLVLPARQAADLDRGGLLNVQPAPGGGDADAQLTAAARYAGRRTLAVVLTGRLTDGARGVRAVKSAGGWVLVQDPDTAAAAGMPLAALSTGCVDHVLPLELIAPALAALVMAPGAPDLLRVPTPSWARLDPVPDLEVAV